MVGKSRRNGVSDQQIIDHYGISHSAYKTAAALGIGDTTVHRALRKAGVERVGLEEYRRNATLFVGREKEIRAVYDSGVPISCLKDHFGEASDYAFRQALKRAGTELRENPAQTIKPGELDLIIALRAAGKSQVDISLEIDRSQSFVSRVMRDHGIPVRSETGKDHSNWKGGRYIVGGYVRVWIDPNDPMAIMSHKDHHVPEHRLVVARKLKRPLLKTETVHHIDGDKTNNDPNNLELRQGQHGKHVVMCCLDCGSRNIGHVGLTEAPGVPGAASRSRH